MHIYIYMYSHTYTLLIGSVFLENPDSSSHSVYRHWSQQQQETNPPCNQKKSYLALLVSDSDVLHIASSSARSYILTSVVSGHLDDNLLFFFGIGSAGIGTSWVKLLVVFPKWSRKYLVMSSRLVFRGLSLAYCWKKTKIINHVYRFTGRVEKMASAILWHILSASHSSIHSFSNCPVLQRRWRQKSLPWKN